MKTQGRPQSTNIEDKRGQTSLPNPVDQQNANNTTFLQQSYDSAATWKGSQSYNKFVAAKTNTGGTNGN